jgi:cytochrome c oxidase subunit 3
MRNETVFTPEEEREREFGTRRLVTYLFIGAIVMFFAGLTSAYVVSMSGGYWVHIRVPSAFYYSTAAILLSSVFAQLALVNARKGAKGPVPALVGITLVLGVLFTWSQFKGWGQLVEQGQFVVGKVVSATGVYGEDYTISRDGRQLILENGRFYMPDDVDGRNPLNADIEEQVNTSSSYFYVLTAAHLAHLGFGLLSLVVMLVMALLGRYGRGSHAGLWAGVVYWHFLGGLWVFLLLFLTFFH